MIAQKIGLPPRREPTVLNPSHLPLLLAANRAAPDGQWKSMGHDVARTAATGGFIRLSMDER